MKVILNKDVPSLGEEGDVCQVADGYGRNYLIPQKIAVPYIKQYIAMFEQKRDAIEKRKEEKRKIALGLKEKLEEFEVRLKMTVGESGKLFGSVNNAAISDELKKSGFSIEKRRIEIPENIIKSLGEYRVRVKLYKNESASLKVIVEAEDGDKKKKEKPKADTAGEKGKAEAETKTETKAETKAETKTEAKVETKTETETKPDSETKQDVIDNEKG